MASLPATVAAGVRADCRLAGVSSLRALHAGAAHGAQPPRHSRGHCADCRPHRGLNQRGQALERASATVPGAAGCAPCAAASTTWRSGPTHGARPFANRRPPAADRAWRATSMPSKACWTHRRTALWTTNAWLPKSLWPWKPCGTMVQTVQDLNNPTQQRAAGRGGAKPPQRDAPGGGRDCAGAGAGVVAGHLARAAVQAAGGAIRQLGENQLDEPVLISGPDDVRRLGQQLEWLRLRLLELDADKARFLRHVSHELKTPLAALREGVALLGRRDGRTHRRPARGRANPVPQHAAAAGRDRGPAALQCRRF